MKLLSHCSGDTLKTYAVDLTPFPTLYREENVLLHKLFERNGYELRIAGGAVRDILLGIPPKDIDYASDATPTQMNEMFSRENIRTLNRNGEAHGTVTARINNAANFEVTTLRIDTEHDGRHAKVVFTNNWRLDAARRDLTVNSMFLGLDLSTLPMKPTDANVLHVPDEAPDIIPSSANENSSSAIQGKVYDYFGGMEDLQDRRIRFVGDPSARICEDYLRILRYFRFHGRLAKPTERDVHHSGVLEAIAVNAAGLSSISGERCWAELKGILCYQSTPLLLRRMFEVGLFQCVGFPETPDFTEMDLAWERGILNHNPNPVTCLATLVSTMDQVEKVNSRLKLSNLELMILVYIVNFRERWTKIPQSDALAHFQREYLLSHEAPNKIQSVLTEMMRYLAYDFDLLAQWYAWEPPRFPVSGHDLRDKWFVPYRDMRHYLSALRRQWVDSDYKLNADDLLSDENRVVVEKLAHEAELEPSLWRTKRARR